MTVTNGYITLAEMRERITQAHTYTAATLGFAASSKKITDSAKGLKRFDTGQYLKVTGSTKNNGYYTVATGGVAGEIVTTEALQDEAAGATVTLADMTDPASDSQIEDAINAACRAIDRICNRRFWKNGTDETRYFTPGDCDELVLEDIDVLTITTLATDDALDRAYSTTWAVTDYELEPANAAADGWPYDRIVTTPLGGRDFEPHGARTVKIVGTFGWAAVPAEVKQAAALLSTRIYRRKEVPFGAFGSTEMGSHQYIPEEDPDARLLLTPYIKEAPRAVVTWGGLDR